MQSGVYNKVVYWPTQLQQVIAFTMSKPYTLVPTYHYFCKAKKLHLPNNCYKAMLYGEIVEVEYDGSVKKIITRLRNRYRDTEDLCSAILLDGDKARVKTVWVNHWEDNHKTINKEAYIQN